MEYKCNFTPSGWNQEDWLLVRSPRWEAHSTWRQETDCIANNFPEDLTAEDTQMGRDRTGETYLSMLYKQPCNGSVRVETTCSFLERMAPLIVFSRELVSVHREHLEVVLYDCGINLWHHFYHDGKPSWKLITCMDLDLKAGEKYTLTTDTLFNKAGKFLVMGCNGKTFGCRIADDWPETYYVGFTACEGKNRFYDFTLSSTNELSEAMKERFTA